MTQLSVFTLTPQAAAQALQDNGLDALGLTMIRLSNAWGSATPTPDNSLTLTGYGTALAPFRGTLEFLDDGSEFRDVTGASIGGSVGAFRLHPQAAMRLGRLMDRYADGTVPHHRLIPETIVFTGAVPVPDRSPRTFEPGESLGRTEPMSFHDNRGLIIDPFAMAAILDDLVNTFPALDFSNGASRVGAGGLTSIAQAASGILVQVTDLHGNAFSAALGDVGVESQDGSSNTVSALDASGMVTLGGGERLAATGSDAASRVRLGWATGGTMGAGPLVPPGLPMGVTLGRQFFRAYAVDLNWHLRGNRTTSAVAGIPAEDGDMPDDLKPMVHADVQIDYIVDGPDYAAHTDQVLARLDGVGGNPMVFAVAPVLADGVRTPTAPGAAARWPAYPGPNTAAPMGANPAPLVGATATWLSGEDVLVELQPNVVPDGASVRLYNQSFVSIPAIGETPSFKRGDGGSAIAVSGAVTQIRVHNPLNLASGDPKPAPATLVFDLVVAPRMGPSRTFTARTLDIAAGPAADPADGFAPILDRVDAVPDVVKSVAPVPIFGTTPDDVPDSASATPVDAARALASETAPRQGPRHPTMGRLEAMTVTGIGDAGAFSTGLSWEGVLSGALWARETVSASHRTGNPGNPAGRDVHVGGVRAIGTLAYDMARHAVRRVQPVIPLPGGPPPDQAPGWVAFSGGENMEPPERNGAVPAGATSSGVLLQTVAAIAETPELSLLPPSNPLASNTPIDLQTVINDIASQLGVPAPSINVANGNRLLNELRREYILAEHGARDGLWSLARAFGEAEELVYVETPGLARTVHPGAPAGSVTIDLIQTLIQRLGARPKLKIVLCTQRETDFKPAPFVRRAIALRNEAIQALQAAAPGRVVAFHPAGFPGRATQLPTTTIVVDDVYSFTGATHLRRRGISFDGSASIASVDHGILDGYSAKVRGQRILSMAARLGIAATDGAGLPVPNFTRLQRPAAAFSLIQDLVEQQGLGFLETNWEGPSDGTVLPQSVDVTDPDGSAGGSLGALLAALLNP